MSEVRTILAAALQEIAPRLSERKAGEIADHLMLRLAEHGRVIVAEDDYESWHRGKVFESDEE
jgi:hypothetical protein